MKCLQCSATCGKKFFGFALISSALRFKSFFQNICGGGDGVSAYIKVGLNHKVFRVAHQKKMWEDNEISWIYGYIRLHFLMHIYFNFLSHLVFEFQFSFTVWKMFWLEIFFWKHLRILQVPEIIIQIIFYKPN